MIALDTNVLVRYLVDDDPVQSGKAAALIDEAIAREDRLFVSQIVLCEAVWVMSAGYGFSRREIAGVIGSLLAARQVVIEGADRVRTALDTYARGAADFADYLILEFGRAAGCERFATFDADLLEQPDVVAP